MVGNNIHPPTMLARPWVKFRQHQRSARCHYSRILSGFGFQTPRCMPWSHDVLCVAWLLSTIPVSNFANDGCWSLWWLAWTYSMGGIVTCSCSRPIYSFQPPMVSSHTTTSTSSSPLLISSHSLVNFDSGHWSPVSYKIVWQENGPTHFSIYHFGPK